MQSTRSMTEDELKAMLKEKAAAEGIDLSAVQNRFTIWNENGNYSSYENSAADGFQRKQKVTACLWKNSSRTAVLDSLEDCLQLVPSDGNVTVCGSR